MRTLLPLLLLAAAAPSAPFTVGGHGYRTLQQAVTAIGNGRGTIVIAPGAYDQCAVQVAGNIAYRAAVPGTAILQHAACEDKAGLVLRGRSASVDGIVFRGYSVNDGNGEGIRIEQGPLTVTRSMFLDSQQGIGGGDPKPQRIAIDHSTFSGLGQCDQAPQCSHSIYLKTPGPVVLTASRFDRGTGGHYVKLRVPIVQITGNRIDDTAGHDTNYLIDLPEGATGVIAGNTFVQGAHKENAGTLIAVAAEIRRYPSAGLRIAGNEAHVATGGGRPAFVGDWSHQRLAIGANRLTGITPFQAH